MSVFDRHFQRAGHGRKSFWVGHSLRISRITLNLNVLPLGVNMSRRGRVDDEGGGHLSGDQIEQLRPMSEVEKARLSVGNIFRSKNVVVL